MASDFCVVQTTCANEEASRALAQAVLEARLAACVQMWPIRSLYLWQGKVADEPEMLVQFKARSSDFEALAAKITALHSYDVPEIICLDIAEGSAAYLKWIEDVTGR